MNITNHILDLLEINPIGLKVDDMTTKFVKPAMLAESLRNMTENGVLKLHQGVYTINVIRPTGQIHHIERTNAGLRDMLVDEMQMLRAGKSHPDISNALCNLSKTVLASLAVDIAHQKLIDKNPAAANKIATVNLYLNSDEALDQSIKDD